MIRARLFTKAHFPRCVEAAVVQVLCNTFARAFGVEAPRVCGLRALRGRERWGMRGRTRGDLYAFREFSAACMEEALKSPAYAAARRDRLWILAEQLGHRMRVALAPEDGELGQLISRMYRIIGIEVEGDLPGMLVFRSCAFSERYTPGLCAFMSAFDEAFISGLCGGARLSFECRITEGFPSCHACLERRM